jgi:hypothetical protein
MDISTEKKEIIKRFKLVHDIDLIKAIKSLLDFGLQKQQKDDKDDEALEASIQRGLSQSEKGLGRRHEEVMADLRKRYNL